jgi:TolB-like protein/Tfp pilus assembly protein PilF
MIAAESSMQLGEGSLFALAEAIADGSRVDWDLAESSAGDGRHRRVVQQLRRLADLSAAARAHSPTWGPFTIRGEIGGGTFGAVYRAWDPRLEREVALKLLHQSDDASAEATVIREARLLARVQHPNVVTVYGADVVDGRVGIWMELIEGRTLKDILKSDGPFGAHEAALIGRDVCRALAAVHREACVHRDVKAQNVMRQAGGRIVLMDFGAGGASADDDASLTGTPAYLAPEVMAGGAHSPQSDIYSLGVLLFHLVSGQFPVVGASLDEMRGVHARGEAMPLRDVRPDLPEAFIRVVERATAASPAARPRSAGALEELLNEALSGERVPHEVSRNPARGRRPWFMAAALAVVLAVAGGIAAGLKWAAGTPAVATRSSVAILPFRNLTPGTDGDRLSAGFAYELAVQLARLEGLRVVSGTSAGWLQDRTGSEIDAGSTANVAAYLDGSIRREGDRVRIVGRLVDARTRQQLWSEGFDGEMADLFTTQSVIARKIAVALRGELPAPDAALLGDSGERNYKAADLYWQGLQQMEMRTEDGLNKSLALFLDAIAEDRHYGLAYAGLADAYTRSWLYGVLPREEAHARAYEAALIGVQLAPDRAETHASLGYVYKNRFEWGKAEATFKRAIAIQPRYAPAHHAYSVLLTQHGRFPEALTEIKTALFLAPRAIGAHLQLGSLLVMSRRYDEALKEYEYARQMEPRLATIHRFMAAPLTYEGRFAEAEAALERADRLSSIGSGDQGLKLDRGYLYAVSGRRADAERVLVELRRRAERAREPLAGSIAAIYTALGDREQAFSWLERASRIQDVELGYLKADPRWDPLRPDARFQTLLTALGFTSDRP